jgi:hypothetical protein
VVEGAPNDSAAALELGHLRACARFYSDEWWCHDYRSACSSIMQCCVVCNSSWEVTRHLQQ